MRPRLLAFALAISTVGASTAHADFDPSGRTRPKPPSNPGTAPPPGPRPPTPPPEDKRSPEVLIKRYTGIVLSQPGAPFPLQRLAQLYRERDGNLKKLVEEFEQKAAAGDDSAWSAKVALAGIYKQDGRHDDAISTYESAINDRPDAPQALMALAQLQSDKGATSEARVLFEKALPHLATQAEKEQVRRTLLSLSLDMKDFEGAKTHHEELVKTSQGSLFVKAELGRALMSRGHHERAEGEFRELVKAATGDNRALAPALRDLGQSLAKQKKTKEALEVLKRALSVAGGAEGVRREILFIMTDAFRVDGRLPELIEILEKEPGRDFERLATLGSLYEETGNVDKALTTYRAALAVNSRHIDTRLRLVHLLQTAGELEEAIVEYEALIKAAPHNSDFVFELCETLIQRGDRPKALALLQRLEGRVQSEPETLAAIADFYERIEEQELAMALYKRLANTQSSDPHFIIDLGDRYYQQGDKQKALDTWARLKSIIPDRAQALARLGEVYLDHDMPSQALSSLREAVKLKPTDVRFKKSLAIALERTATTSGNPTLHYNEARAIWEELLASAGKNQLLAREARTHIVSLWGLTRELASRVTPLKSKFEGSPPDLEAGRLLAEVQRKLHRLPDAESTLRRIVELAPGDEQSLLALERVLVQQKNLRGAIDALAKLVEVNPKRARQYYQRMAQYAAELYLDDEAILYAAKAVELSPNDASGHEKLGDMYRRRQDFDKAIAEYRQAISKNDRLFPVYFDLAELLLTAGEVDEADRLFRRVVRATRDEELVARAARMSMQINLGKGTLESLERELLPVAVGNPQKPLYRRLLVELYGAMTLPLVQKVRHRARLAGDLSAAPAALKTAEEEAKAARTELAAIGARAVKPLLDALADDDESQQKIAIEVLAYVENKGAGPSLFNYATGNANKSLRTRAMVAVGALRDPELLGRYEQLLAPGSHHASVASGDSVAVAAAWGVARMGAGTSNKLLTRLLQSASPEVRAMAALGLGRTGDANHAAELAKLARSPEAGPLPRAAALTALGELGGRAAREQTTDVVAALAGSRQVDLRRAALLAAARLNAGQSKDADTSQARAIRHALAEAIFSEEADLRRTAALAASVLSSGTYPRSGEPLPVPDGVLTARGALRSFEPDPFDAPARARAQIELTASLRQAAVAAVATSPGRAQVVADTLRDGGFPGLAPFGSPSDELTGNTAQELGSSSDQIGAAVVSGFAALVRHPEVNVRTRAVEWLGGRPEDNAQRAVVDALGDPNDAVVRAALSSLGPVKHDATAIAVAELLQKGRDWPLRVQAAQALGRLGESAGAAKLPVATHSRVRDALAQAARNDAFALVRESAMRASVAVQGQEALSLLGELANSDGEPRVREEAKRLRAELGAP